MENVSAEFASTPVYDPSGRQVPLGEAWAHRPAALVFIRHFG